MSNSLRWNRRYVLQAMGAGAIGALSGATLHAEEKPDIKGRLKQSACKWCYGKLPLEKLAEELKKIGYQSIELLVPQEFEVVKKAGLTCAILGGASISDGFNRKEFHEKLEKHLREYIDFAAKEGIPSVICMSGDRKGMPDDMGLDNCVIGLKKVLGYAEEKKVTLIMEGLNSKVDHKDYMYDSTKWGAELCKRLGSERFKLLYDIYHMQIMEGDVIRTIKQSIASIAHFHTAGNPGRNEFDDTQEMNYTGICKVIADTGYQGYISHEYTPNRDPLGTLDRMMKLCEV